MSAVPTVTVPLATSAADLKITKAETGSSMPLMAATVIPATGDPGVVAGTPVIGVVQEWKSSAVYIAARRVILLALAAGGGAASFAVIKAGSVYRVHGHDLVDAFVLAGLPIIASALIAFVARNQNNPTT